MANERVFDVRILERNLDKGLISREEYDAYLASLDDAGENATVIEAEFVVGVFDNDDDDDASTSEEE